jgi:predicted nucleotidyltransferase
MRLQPAEREAIRSACAQTLPAGACVRLFGSRLDDLRRGGDIDLLVELPQPLPAEELVARRSRFAARLYRALGEQRIDIVMTVAADAEPDPRPVVAEARRHGVELARA